MNEPNTTNECSAEAAQICRLAKAIDNLYRTSIASKQMKQNGKDAGKSESYSQPIIANRRMDFEEVRNALKAQSQPTIDEKSTTTKKIDRKIEVIIKVEEVISKVRSDIENNLTPKFELRNQKLWNNCLYSKRLILKPIEEARKTVVSNSGRFNLITTLLYTIHKMLLEGTTCTKRELYYQQITSAKNQRSVDDAVRDICCLLECPPWELGILATSKGLVAGPLTLLTAEGRLIDCMNDGGVLIPQDVVGIKEIKSSAKFVLVIEKDATFQKLLSERALNRLGPCILITGKGYPDVNTRLLVKKLAGVLLLPVLALMDADPHGIEIMCTYRFGSLAHSHLSIDLAVPSMRWLGIHPTDIASLGVPSLPLTTRDIAKLASIVVRPYLQDGAVADQLEQQICTLTRGGKKAEIEGVGSLSSAYLTDRYIPHKIICGDII